MNNNNDRDHDSTRRTLLKGAVGAGLSSLVPGAWA